MQNDSYNRGGYIAFLFSMVFSLAFFVYVTVIHPGINLKEVPEVSAAQQTVAQVDISKIEKPWEENADMVAHGKKIFDNTCAVCHGKTGEGDGPGAAGANPPVRNLVEGKWKKGGDSIGLFHVLQEGFPPPSTMVSFKAAIKPADRWALVQYIRSITKNKVKDDPAKLEAFAKTAD